MNVLLLLLVLKLTLEQCGFKGNVPKYRLEEEDHNLRRLQAATPFSPIRIYYDYTTLDNQSDIPSDFRENIKKVLSITKLIYERILSVQRFTFPIKIRACDSRVTI